MFSEDALTCNDKNKNNILMNDLCLIWIEVEVI